MGAHILSQYFMNKFSKNIWNLAGNQEFFSSKFYVRYTVIKIQSLIKFWNSIFRSLAFFLKKTKVLKIIFKQT